MLLIKEGPDGQKAVSSIKLWFIIALVNQFFGFGDG
jgi:hypothetical protein